jgi:hypothetical protein
MDSGSGQAHTFRMRTVNRIVPAAAILTAMAMPAYAQTAAGDPFDRLLRSAYVNCAFYREYDIDPDTGDRILVEGQSRSLMHYQRRRDGQTISIDTRRSGAVTAAVVRGPRYLHFIERLAGMYVVTTVYACLERDPSSGVCVYYGAVNSRHFDHRVLREPDAVFDELQASPEPGFCDHSFINLQSASVLERPGSLP